MEYLSLWFYLFVVILVGLYYVVPVRIRWTVLLLGSVAFYARIAGNAWWIFVLTTLLSYGAGIWLYRRRSRFVLAGSVFFVVLPWLICKNGQFLWGNLLHGGKVNLLVPVGISFYTLQIIAYLVDIYREKTEPQKNVFKYVLFVSFFPQIIQGPIPRYEQLNRQLYAGHRFDEEGFTKGLHLIVWGFFLKMMIADKAAVVVNAVFEEPAAYAGCYILVAGILYSIELYTDFLACVSISQGVAALFGIRLVDNFAHPYLALSVKDFWRRWHMSLSTWLRDYIYIPLGGNRKGRVMKYVNLFVTFLISGLWHGAGWNYIVWGAMHGIYQVVGDATGEIKNRIYDKCGMQADSFSRKLFQRIGTCFFVMIAWIMFRADSLQSGMLMLRNMFTTWNPWILFDDSLFDFGLDMKDFVVLLLSVLVLCVVSVKQEKESVRNWILRQNLVIRWSIYIGAIIAIWVFGTYGYGFDAQQFIYGGF